METVITLTNAIIIIGMKRRRRRKHFPKTFKCASALDLRIIYDHQWQSLNPKEALATTVGVTGLVQQSQWVRVTLSDKPGRTTCSSSCICTGQSVPPGGSYLITFSSVSNCDWYPDGYGVRQLCGSLSSVTLSKSVHFSGALSPHLDTGGHINYLSGLHGFLST